MEKSKKQILKKKHTLYVVGGKSRTGKTIIATQIMRRRKNLFVVFTDVMRTAIQKLLVGETKNYIDRLSFRVTATYRTPGGSQLKRLVRSKNNQEKDDLAWVIASSLIKSYDRKNTSDVLVEGVAITPRRVWQLKLKNLNVRAVFLGYSHRSHAASIIEHSKKKRDWVYEWIEEHKGDESHVHQWVREGIKKSVALEKAAKKYGYRYIDITHRPFEKQVKTAIDYLFKTKKRRQLV